MKKFILPLLIVFVAGCSSAPKDSSAPEVTETNEPVITDASADEKTPAPPAAAPVEAAPERPKAPPPQTLYTSLNEAIKAQSDDRIYTAATQILAQSPNDPRALNALAMYQYKKARFDLARYLLSKAIVASPRMAELHSNMGIVQLAQKENRDAVKSFRKALEISSEDPVAASNLGAIYVQEKDYSKALVVLEIAHKKGVRDFRVLNNYAIALTAAKKFDRAAEIYKTVLKDQSSNREVLYNYVVLLIDHMGKYQDGLEALGRLKFVGGPGDTRNRIIALENKAKAGLK
jgi:Flp pilus assembly protein TadD